MRSKRNLRGILVLATCLSTTVAFTGCRSGKGMNLFSFRSEPSPEALAGDGPTTTYPTPPSATATPEAITSLAGGTGSPTTTPITSPSTGQSPTAQVAALGNTPGYIKPATQNMSAAQANGFMGTKGAGFSPPPAKTPAITPAAPTPEVTTPKTTTSGYQFGTNPAAKSAGGSSYTIPSSYTAPSAPKTSTPNMDVPAAGATTAGFTLPANLSGTVEPAGGAADACASCDGCNDCKSSSSPSAIFTPSESAGGYSPGSLSNAGSYPTPSN